MKRLFLASVALMSLAAACASESDAKGFEEDAPLDGAYDSFRSPTDHGTLVFTRADVAELTAAQGFHTWTFTLTGPATVTLRTQSASTSPRAAEIDTVLYLYREGTSGWGRALTSNDDASRTTLFSRISRTLTAGRYRVLVKGYARSTRGQFGVVVECSGAGCAASTGACLFGGVFGQLPESPRVRVSVVSQFRAASELNALQASQLVSAMAVSGHPEATTADAALALAVDHQAERSEIYDGPGGRAFSAWRFVLGDHYFGAIFRAGTTDVVTRIVDNENQACTVGFEVCTVGSRYRDFREARGLTVVSDRVLRSPSGLPAAKSAQLVRAVKEAYEEVTTPAQAFSSVDGSEVNEAVRRDASTNRSFTAYEYGAGDNSYGAIFEGESATPVAVIHDGDLYGCTAFSPAPPAAHEGEACSRAIPCEPDFVCHETDPDEETGVCGP